MATWRIGQDLPTTCLACGGSSGGLLGTGSSTSRGKERMEMRWKRARRGWQNGRLWMGWMRWTAATLPIVPYRSRLSMLALGSTWCRKRLAMRKPMTCKVWIKRSVSWVVRWSEAMSVWAIKAKIDLWFKLMMWFLIWKWKKNKLSYQPESGILLTFWHSSQWL